MVHLKYKVIKSDTQYDKYCKKIEQLLDSGSKSKAVEDEIDLLTILIEKYDDDHSTVEELDPIEMLKSFMDDHKMKSKDLATLLGISTGLVSNILSYKKGLSKESIRILADKFKVRQDAFNRPYQLKGLILSNKKKKTTTLPARKLKMAG